MISIPEKIKKFNFEDVPVDSFWNIGDEQELKIHHIHSYPAKFPAFITTKALGYAKKIGYNVNYVADIFCGCGTTAFEARRNNISFWGCDINPVATLIAKTKSQKYQLKRLNGYYEEIVNTFTKTLTVNQFLNGNERLKYWYHPTQYNDLALLKTIILEKIPENSKYKTFFLCAFSNILKITSKWLTKSIKPQTDPNKKCADVLKAFVKQCNLMFSALKELENYSDSKSEIITDNFLSNSRKPEVDMIITSPPYVTSYEYADLHQLSALWLDFTDDYRKLRDGSIGSQHNIYNFAHEFKLLNDTGNEIVSLLLNSDKSQARSVARYFLDMQIVAKKSYDMLSCGGIALFVIGNTEYKNVRIDNAKHLSESLYKAGFSSVLATKRKIINKILTPYRDSIGKFTSDSNGRKIYSEEFILIGNKN